jgi:hypothetical protein
VVVVSYPKIEIYDVIYLRTVNRCRYETVYTLPPKEGHPTVLILKLQLQAFLR